ncbi:15863_t:CDS:2, partial [Acaulospora morrowiae]
PSMLIGSIWYCIWRGWIFIQENLRMRVFRGRTCEVKISKYYYGQLCEKIWTYGRDIEVLERELKQASETGRFLSEYDNGIIVFKSISRWRMIRNRITNNRYMRASVGLRVIGRRIGITNNVQTIQLKGLLPSEKQAYVSLLRKEAKGITNMTLRLGYQHGRPLDISLDESNLYRYFQPTYQNDP